MVRYSCTLSRDSGLGPMLSHSVRMPHSGLGPMLSHSVQMPSGLGRMPPSVSRHHHRPTGTHEQGLEDVRL